MLHKYVGANAEDSKSPQNVLRMLHICRHSPNKPQAIAIIFVSSFEPCVLHACCARPTLLFALGRQHGYTNVRLNNEQVAHTACANLTAQSRASRAHNEIQKYICSKFKKSTAAEQTSSYLSAAAARPRHRSTAGRDRGIGGKWPPMALSLGNCHDFGAPFGLG